MQYFSSKTRKWFFILGLGWLFCFFIPGLSAELKHNIPAIHDPHHVLQTTTFEHMTQFLAESANKRNVWLWVFMMKEESGQPLSILAQERMAKFENDYPTVKHIDRQAALFVNVATNESQIILSDKIATEQGLREGVLAIYQEILAEQMANNQIDKALWETTVALGMALEQYAQPVKALVFVHKINQCLTTYHLWVWIRWMFGISFLILLLSWMKKWFHRPHWEETLDHELLASLPENLSLHELTALMTALRKDQDI